MKKILKWFCYATGIPTYFFKNIFIESKMAFVRLQRYTPNFRWRLTQVKSNPAPSIVFGCGETSYSNWINVDCFFADHVDLVLDLRRRLPFDDQTISFCYSEHFLEHLLPVEAGRHLVDVCRVLKPGGIYRIVVPDTGKFMQRYSDGDTEFFSEAHPWETYPIDAIYSIVNWGGDHRSIYDFEALKRIGLKAGFRQVSLSSVNNSRLAKLNIDRTDKHRILESLYVEMVKTPDAYTSH